MTLIRNALVLGLAASLAGVASGIDICETTARLQRKSAKAEAKEEFNVNLAVCLNLTDDEERAECLIETFVDYAESLELADESFDARIELCEKLGGGAYDPEIDPEKFVDEIDNPYLPFPVGAEWVYEGETEDGLETILVTVLDETREILGVECRSVRDVVSIDGEAVEDTIDWYAQDCDGNVWYFGEISFTFEDGFIDSIEGSWLAGKDGAKPGIVMLANPTVGTTYRQEWLLGDAEDAGTVLAIDAVVDIDYGLFTDCVQTADFLPPEPDALEHKFYAPGIGFILETVPGEDETVELISVSGL